MVVAVRAQLDLHEAAVETLKAIYANDQLFDDAVASLAERDAGGKPTPREQLVRK